MICDPIAKEMTQIEIKELRDLCLRKYIDAIDQEYGALLIDQLGRELKHWDEQIIPPKE